jgi:glycosyltransferase involved in cell wall biosynthesis
MLDPDNHFYLYASRPLLPGVASASIHTRVARYLSFLPGTFWQQLRIPALARADRLDCFWGPSHVLPLNLPRTVRAVLTVNDLVAHLFPETMEGYNALVHRLFWRKSIRRADALIAISEQTKRDLVNQFGVDESRVTVIHLGVEPTFRPLPADVVNARLSALGISGDYILSVGTLEPRKNYPVLFRALARMPDGLSLVIAGRRGWKYHSLFKMRQQLGLEQRVRLLEYVPTEDLVALYNGARLYVQPSVYEGFGLPLLQAMACGLPILSSNWASLVEIAADAAAYFDPRSVESLQVEMTRLLGDGLLLNRMRARGLERARQFTWERTAEKTLRVLKGEPQQ